MIVGSSSITTTRTGEESAAELRSGVDMGVTLDGVPRTIAEAEGAPRLLHRTPTAPAGALPSRGARDPAESASRAWNGPQQ
ncbi:hypothetical protein GCM10017597_31100 [Brachybacterium conglomeratum]|nr:hypothetical protein GCM10017597_31100 [Brachybacterium conglomeratum]